MATPSPKPKLQAQASKRPTRKVEYGTYAGTPAAIVIVWLVAQLGIDMPLEVGMAFAAVVGSLLSQAVAYFTWERADG